MNRQEKDNLDATLPWWRQRWPWLLMAGPALAIVGCAITIVLAFQIRRSLMAASNEAWSLKK